MKVTIEEIEKMVTLDGKAIADAASKANVECSYNPSLKAEQKKENPINNLEIKLDVKPKEDFEIPDLNEFDGHGIGCYAERGKRIYWNKKFSDACEEILDILVKHRITMWDLNIVLDYANCVVTKHSVEILGDKNLSETCKEIVHTILKFGIKTENAKTVFKYVYHLARQNSPVVAEFPE